MKRLVGKLIINLLPLLSILRLKTLVISNLNKLRKNSNKYSNFDDIISKSLLKKKLILLDVGGMGGLTQELEVTGINTKKYEKYFDPIIVEPIPSEVEKLKGKYNVIAKGLWSSKCTKKLYMVGSSIAEEELKGENFSGSSMYEPWQEGFDLYTDDKLVTYKEIEVECSTINDVLNDLNITELDFLKIDTQGSEYEILKGIGRFRPLVMKVEVQIFNMYKKIPHWSELLNYIHRLDYMLCSWESLGGYITQSPVEMEMIFIPNFSTEKGRKLILSRENEFIFLMLILGQIRLLQFISKKLGFKLNNKIINIRDKFFD